MSSRIKEHGMFPVRGWERWELSVVVLVDSKSQQGGSEAELHVAD